MYLSIILDPVGATMPLSSCSNHPVSQTRTHSATGRSPSKLSLPGSTSRRRTSRSLEYSCRTGHLWSAQVVRRFCLGLGSALTAQSLLARGSFGRPRDVAACRAFRCTEEVGDVLHREGFERWAAGSDDCTASRLSVIWTVVSWQKHLHVDFRA